MIAIVHRDLVVLSCGTVAWMCDRCSREMTPALSVRSGDGDDFDIRRSIPLLSDTEVNLQSRTKRLATALVARRVVAEKK